MMREELLNVYNSVAKLLVRELLASLGKSAEYEHYFRDLQASEEGRPTKTPPASPAWAERWLGTRATFAMSG